MSDTSGSSSGHGPYGERPRSPPPLSPCCNHEAEIASLQRRIFYLESKVKAMDVSLTAVKDELAAHKAREAVLMTVGAASSGLKTSGGKPRP